MLTQLSIDHLLKRCKKQDQKAQLEVYRRFHGMMYHSALRIVGHPEDAEDVMQESFLAAFEKLEQYQGQNRFGGWLKQITIRKAIHHAAKQAKMSHSPDGTLEIEAGETAIAIAEEATSKIQQLHAALYQLNPRYRQVICLHYLEGMDQEEICGLMVLLPGTYRTLMSRAKEQLRKKMNDHGMG